MAKFTLIQNPTFKADVMIPRVGGEPVKVEFEFKYLDRTALAALYAEWGERHRELGLKVEEMDLKEFTAAKIDLEVDQIKAVVAGCSQWLRSACHPHHQRRGSWSPASPTCPGACSTNYRNHRRRRPGIDRAASLSELYQKSPYAKVREWSGRPN